MLPIKLVLRYLWSGRFSTKFVTVITLLGIFLASFALVFTVGVMNGFERAVKEGLLKNLPHLQIFLFSAKEIPFVEKTVEGTLERRYKAIYWYASFGLILEKGPNVVGTTVFTSNRKILEKFVLTKLNLKLKEVKSNCLYIGQQLAFKLNIEKVPSSVLVIDPVAKRTPIGFIPEIKRFQVCGIYQTNFSGYDDAAVAVYSSLERYFSPSIYSIVVELKNPYKADQYRALLSKKLSDYYISTWIDTNRDFFNALKLEKLGMVLVVGLISLVAAFNITALLFMKIKELRKDFAIFRTYGIGQDFILKIVLLLGLLIAIVAGGLGVAAADITAQIFTKYKVIRLPEDVYLTPYLPVEPGFLPSLVIFLFVLLLSLLAAYIPAKLAAKEKITDILRNE